MALCDICNSGKDYTNLGVHKMHCELKGLKTPGLIVDEQLVEDQKFSTKLESPKETSNLENVLSSVVNTLQRIDERLTNLEVKTGSPDNSFRKGVQSADVKQAEITRIGVDEKIVQIVDQVLGEDFGIEVTPREGQPGLNFTLLVPRRLSNVEENERPVVGEDGEYIIDSKTKLPKQERYWPGDQRTRAIAAHQSYDSIKEHCEKVRAYLVTYYQKLNRPVPEFKLKQNYV